MKKKQVYKKIVAVTVGTAILVDASVMSTFASEEDKEVKSIEVASQTEDSKSESDILASVNTEKSIVEKDVKVNNTIYVGSVGVTGAPSGSGTQDDPYKYIDQAVEAAQDGDTIVVLGNAIIKGAQDDSGASLPYTITKEVTFIGSSREVEMLWNRPIQLGADVTFQNLRITLPHTGGENCIYAAGYHLTLDNVETYINNSIRPPYLFGGGYKDLPVGSNAQITIRNANERTIFSGVYAGTKFKNFVGDVTINIDANTTIGTKDNPSGVYASGLRGRLPQGLIDYDCRVEGNVNINVTMSGLGNRIYLFDGFGATDANGNPSANLSLTGVNNQAFRATSFNNITFDNSNIALNQAADFIGVSGNLKVINNTKLDLSKAQTTTIGGDFIGSTDTTKAGILILNTKGLLDVTGTVAGNTHFISPNPGSIVGENSPISGPVEENHTYITSSANAAGEFLFKPYSTIHQIHMSLAKEQDGGKTKWVVRKEQHTLKNIEIDGPTRVTVDEVKAADDSDNGDAGVVFAIKSIDTNNNLFATDVEYKVLDENGQESTRIEADYSYFDADNLVQYAKLYPSNDTLIPGIYKLQVIEQTTGNTYEYEFEVTATLTDTVEITGEPKVGKTLTAKVDGLPQGVNEQDLTYQWYVNGTPIQGATSKDWVVDANVQDEVYVEVSHPSYANTLKSSKVSVLDKDAIFGTVAISGGNRVGDLLSADITNFVGDSSLLNYQWYADGNPIPNADSDEWTGELAYIGKEITVSVTHPNYNGSLTSQPIILQKQLLTGQITIANTVMVSNTISVDTTQLPQGNMEYQWYADGVLIPNANVSTYIVEKEYLGKQITVVVSVENYEGTVTSNACTVLANDLTGTVAITGTAEPGQTLTADITGLPANVYDLTYQWYVDGNPIEGATGATWVSDAHNVGLPITVEVTAKNYTSSVMSAPVTLQKASIIGKGQVTIIGTAEPGQTLTADVSSLPNDTGDISYQWYVDGNPIAGATEKVWIGDANYIGLPITVEITTTNYNDKLESSEVVLSKIALFGTVSIDGTPKVDETLTAVLENLPQDAGDLSYQWFANGNPIPNATNATWIAEYDYVDATITVQVSAKNYNDHVTSAGVVLAKKDLIGTVTIDGIPKVDETLTAILQNVPNDAQNVTIKWYAGDKEIAVGDTWVSIYDYAGQDITVRVTADNYAGELVSDKVILAKKDIIGAVSISGTPQFSETLTAVIEQIPADAQNVKYEWYADGVLVNDVTGDTWTPGKDIVGKTVVVKVTADNYAGELTSIGVVLQAKDITGDVVINGISKPWQELTADVTNLPVDAQNISYQWYANGVAIPGATSASWIVERVYEGQTITVHVIADNYTGSITSSGVVVQPADEENITTEGTNIPNTGDSTNVFMLLLMAFGAILTKVGILFKDSKEKE